MGEREGEGGGEVGGDQFHMLFTKARSQCA